MWTAILSLATAALGVLSKILGGDSGKADQRELGRAEQQNADMKDGMATVRAANDAARQAETEPEPEHDPHDRARRR